MQFYLARDIIDIRIPKGKCTTEERKGISRMTTEQARYTQDQVDEMIARAIRQDREFQAQVLRNLPLLNTEARQGWIERPTELQLALSECMIPPVPPPNPPTTPMVFKTTGTDLDKWLDEAEKFAKDHLGVEVKLRKRFAIPKTLPWKSAIPVFDPGNLTNRAMFKLLNKLGLNPWEEMDVMQYSGSKASGAPTLHLIQNSVRPDEDTMGMSPDQLVATQKSWIELRGYGLAFGLHHVVTNEYLDPQTFTWFPGNRLRSVRVARGYWDAGARQVRFLWYYSFVLNPDGGARLAMSVPLIP